MGSWLIDQGSTVEFKADNKYEAKAPGETPETGTWMLSEDGTTLTIDEGDQDEVIFDVQTLTDASLILTATQENKDDYDLDGEEDSLVGEIILNFSK